MTLHPLQSEWDADLASGDPLAFPGYADSLARADGESVRTGRTPHYVLIEGRFGVLGGSMGVVAGEKVVRAYRRAVDLGLPVVVRSASGGARMQEGMLSLIQMARTAAAARDHAEAGLLSVALLRHPTTGGVYASYSSLCDVRAGHAGATIGFAGPRVVEQTVGIKLAEGLHTAESARRQGLIDAVVDDGTESGWLDAALGIGDLAPPPPTRQPTPATGAATDAWAEVQRARDSARPSGWDWARLLASSWVELAGTDPAVRAGIARVADRRVVVVATDRHAGHGRPTPAGFKLAQRAVGLASRLRLPVLSFVDTPGADPGPDSEAAGIAGEIARTFAALDSARGPTVAVCVGEGGSGGALALAHCDVLLIQEHAVFSVIGPEGAAAILERDANRAPDVAARLGLTAGDLRRLAIVDGVVAEDRPVERMREAVGAALATAEPGDRRRRWDTATATWLRGG